MEKKELRQEMKNIRNTISEEEKKMLDSLIFEKVISSEYFENSSCIFVYVSFGSEVETHRIINYSLANNKTICVPKVISRSEGMKAVKIRSLEELQKSSFGVLEPKDLQDSIDPKEIDLLLIPGLAFDLKGGRIGYGAGYYDRFLNAVRDDSYKVGLAYHFQIVPSVPMNENDTFIDHIIVD